MNHYILLSLFFLLYSFLSTGYSSGEKSRDFTIKELISAPDTVQIKKVKVVLETYLWRDFMPVSPPNGKPMRAVVTLLPLQNESLPAGIDASRIWVIYKEETWSSQLSTVSPAEPGMPVTRLEKTAANGPKWGPGVEVTVVVEILDNEGKTYLIKADHQNINRTD
jgi:hypothetical protein